MKWFLRTSVPPIERMLLVESGPRADAQRLVPVLREAVCGTAPIDLFTCLPDRPSGLGRGSRTWRTYDATSHSERWSMLLGVRRQRHSAAAILCSDSPLLGIWKIVLAASLPAKVLLVDKGSALLWLDRGSWRKAARLAISRSGLCNPELVRRLAHAAFVPFALCILIPFAVKVHLRKLIRSTSMADRADRNS